MTKEEKIITLKKLMRINFEVNFGKRYTMGLCTLFRRVTNYEDLFTHFPELASHVPIEHFFYYWWEHKGYFKPWWERHVAIWKTIKQLKKS